MTKYRVEAVHYIEAGDWKEAEQQVEGNLSTPEEITSRPAGTSATDYLHFAISKRIIEEHSKIYFSKDSDEYRKELDRLKEQTYQWFNINLNNILKSNEDRWSN